MYFIIMISVTVFIITKDNRLNCPLHLKRIISILTSASFGVYLIHPMFLDLFNEIGVFNGW